MSAHINNLNKNIHRNPHLQNAWNKYGQTAFSFEIISIHQTDMEALAEEQNWLDKHYGKNYFYNKSKHAQLDPLHIRKQISKSLKGKLNPMFGNTHTKIARDKIRNSRLGVVMSTETKDKISQSLKAMYDTGQKIPTVLSGKLNPFYGKTHSNATREKLSDLAKGRKPMLGKKHSSETKRKMSEMAKKRIFTSETRAKMRDSALKRVKHLSVASPSSSPPHLTIPNC